MYMAAERAKTKGACKSVDKPFKRRNETRLRRSFAPQKFQPAKSRLPNESMRTGHRPDATRVSFAGEIRRDLITRIDLGALTRGKNGSTAALPAGTR